MNEVPPAVLLISAAISGFVAFTGSVPLAVRALMGVSAAITLFSLAKSRGNTKSAGDNKQQQFDPENLFGGGF